MIFTSKDVISKCNNCMQLLQLLNKTMTKMILSTPSQPSSPLPSHYITSSSIIDDNKLCNTDHSYEYDSLLPHNRLDKRFILPYRVVRNKMEQGHVGIARADTDWQAVTVLKSPLCGALPYVLEYVQLKYVNFGFRWRNIRERPDPFQPSCIMGPHWYLMLTTWAVFCVLTLVINVLTFGKATILELLAGIFLSSMSLTCYALVGCKDPGIVKRIDMPLDDTYTYCDHCNSYRPERALHCMECRVCIEEYDHHCPWTGKCVGKGNVHYFYAWLLFLVLAFVYEVIELTTYLLPPEGQQSLLGSSNDSLEIILRGVTPAPHL